MRAEVDFGPHCTTANLFDGTDIHTLIWQRYWQRNFRNINTKWRYRQLTRSGDIGKGNFTKNINKEILRRILTRSGEN